LSVSRRFVWNRKNYRKSRVHLLNASLESLLLGQGQQVFQVGSYSTSLSLNSLHS
jgi:hypothetical protein